MASNPVQLENSQVIGKKAFSTACTCGKSMLALQLPHFHCPCCHVTYRVRSLAAPQRCSRCQFNVWKWRVRNGIVIPEIGMAI